MPRGANPKMPELIDRDAVLKLAYHYYYPSIDHLCCSVKCAEYYELKALPTIKATPARHGQWIFVGEETMHDGWVYRKHKCTECDYMTVEAKNFCQNCGAKMDGGVENDD